MRNRLSHSLRLALAQLNTVRDIGEYEEIIENIAAARDRGASVVFPELAVTGRRRIFC